MKRVLVTGANKGIGLAIAKAILTERADAFVLLGSRDPERGRAAKSSLLEHDGSWADRVEVVEIDVSSDASVTAAADHVGTTYGAEPAPLYGVVNNAGIVTGSVGDVLEVNTYGVRRVCEAFLPLLDPAGRIVNVTSASGPNYVADCDADGQRFFVDPNVQWSALEALMRRSVAEGSANPYGLSKACTNSYTMLLARENPGLRINACTPGFIETDATRPWADAQGKTPAEMGMKPPSEGTRSTLFLLFGEPEGSGFYYGSDAKRSPLDRYRAPGTPPYTGD